MILTRKAKTLSFCLASALLLLTACSANEYKPNVTESASVATIPEESGTSTSEQQPAASIEPINTEQTEAEGETKDTESPETTEKGEDDSDKHNLSAALEAFPLETFTAPDGSEHSKYEAVSGIYDPDTYSNSLCFDFSYIRYAQPIYYDTDSNPEIYDFENNAKGEIFSDTLIKDAEYFQVKAGQTLNNGLTVSEAYTNIHSSNNDKGYGVSSSEVRLDGSLTMSGIIYKYSDDVNFILEEGDLLFYPNPVANENFPAPFTDSSDSLSSGIDLNQKFAFIADSTRLELGNISESDINLTSIFDNGDYAKVKVTVTDIVIRYFESGGGNRCRGTLTAIETQQ